MLFESNNGYKKVYIWKDEVPFNYTSHNTLELSTIASDIHWHNGIICVEARLSCRHISNYAMVFMKYTHKKTGKTDIIINYGAENFSFESQIEPYNKMVCAGLDKEFADSIYDFFREYPPGKLPGGTIEILSGGYDEVGSSIVSFKKVMELLVFIFQNIDKLDNDKLQSSLLSLI